jgi:formamidopyrimidine-DNA glycosylase
VPELPEVHTTVAGLKKTIIGKKIVDTWSDFHLNTNHGERQNIKNKKYFADFKKRVLGAKIVSVERVGKHIVINLSNGESIVVHMKMTGHLLVAGFEKEKKFIHFTLKFSDKSQLAFSDIRKFGTICVTKTETLSEHPGIAELGPDALKINSREFAERILGKKNWPIKLTLLDQSVLAGIGNIYSDEILWDGGVHPLSSSDRIPLPQVKKMYSASKKILEKSIRLGGDSMSDYINAFGEKGGFQKCHQAYRRTGEPCTKRGCGGIISRLVIGGRSSHFCSQHQIKYK